MDPSHNIDHRVYFIYVVVPTINTQVRLVDQAASEIAIYNKWLTIWVVPNKECAIIKQKLWQRGGYVGN